MQISGSTPATSGRSRRLQRLLAAGVALVSVAGAASCDIAGASSAPPEPAKGGTLYVITSSDFDVLDPQRAYEAREGDVLRLLDRTLTTYKSVPGTTASEIVPDLATDLGRPSQNNTVWDFRLKQGIQWQDGSTVTCQQVKYGIERRFSRDPIMGGGAPYPLLYLKDNPDPYQGPWVANDNNGKGLESIKCLDDYDIQFHLNQPVGDFGYTVAMSTFAPVPPKEDGQAAYARQPFSNGPYKIQEHTDKQLVLVRNKFWQQKTDPVRKQYPDKIVFKFEEDKGGVVTNQLIEDQGIYRDAVMLDANVAPNFLQQVVNDPGLLSRTINGPVGAVLYLAINTKLMPNKLCREALIYAINKRKYRAVTGGSALGDYATTMIPLGMKAHKDFDIYDSLANPEGNPQKAQQLLSQAADEGHPCPSKISLAFPDTLQRRRAMATVVEAYQLIGIEVDLKALDPSTYYNSGIGDPANPYDLMLAGWLPDWPNGSTIIPPLFDGRLIPKLDATGHAIGNINFSLFNDKEINAEMDAAMAEASPERQWALWGDLDMQIQEQAVTIPLVYPKALRLRGSNVAGGFIHPAFGMPDLSALGLIKPTP